MCKCVDSPDLLATISLLRLHYIMPFQAMSVDSLLLRQHYVSITLRVSIINGSSHNCLCDPFTEAVTFYGSSRTSCSQNSLIGFFNVDFDFFAFVRTHDLGLQVKLFYGSLLSLTIFIIRHVLVIFVYRFTVEDFSHCNLLSPLDL
ncbi:hypothetical protein IGI04_021619 [Brassica rapa subsp. trilocularis]|uniref:Uncharacterized protein n=1 Tax=Brassica rapa subsp. trilocularis TaxID=1813537 RepID=A0ABQ7M2R0_BRACM|nr:hypothetical protein IGI04_021619 [Brassica rapa subsp. trilocularis]